MQDLNVADLFYFSIARAGEFCDCVDMWTSVHFRYGYIAWAFEKNLFGDMERARLLADAVDGGFFSLWETYRADVPLEDILAC